MSQNETRDRSDLDGPRLSDPQPLVVVLDNLRSAFNVGAIFRTCEAARVSHLYLCGITPYPPNEKLERPALGTTFRVPWSHHRETVPLIRRLRAQGTAVWAAEITPEAQSLRSVIWGPNLALVLGHETVGVDAAVLREVDGTVEIPMYGQKNSLNVATSAGILLFEALRQWGY